MAIKSSGSPNPPLSFTEIEAEFGQNNSRSLGDYRITQSVGQLSDLPLDNGIPQGNAQIAFSDFYSKRLNIVVDCFSTDAQSGGVEEERVDAKTDKWNNNKVVVIGGGSKKEAGSKIIIHVNKKICSIQQGDQATQQVCALKTGNWNNTSNVQVDLGSSTQILGAGGNGGKGQNGISETAGQDGLPGNSALGIESDNAIVNVGSGAVIRCGFGGGGGGDGGRQVDKGSDRRASGGGGGGGAGCPAGSGGAGGSVQSGDNDSGGNPGKDGDELQGGAGGSGGDNQDQAGGNEGGSGADPDDTEAGNGGASGGANGAAIRRTAGFSITINTTGTATGLGALSGTGVTGATDAEGVS